MQGQGVDVVVAWGGGVVLCENTHHCFSLLIKVCDAVTSCCSAKIMGCVCLVCVSACVWGGSRARLTSECVFYANDCDLRL